MKSGKEGLIRLLPPQSMPLHGDPRNAPAGTVYSYVDEGGVTRFIQWEDPTKLPLKIRILEEEIRAEL